MSWIFYALLSAIFAAITSILAKFGLENVDSNLATAVRTVIIFLFAWGIVFVQGTYKDLGSISRNALVFLILSGIATGLSWIFYFKALQIGEASKVVPIDKLSLVFTIILAGIALHENITAKVIAGVVMMVLGSLFIVL